MQYDNTNSGVMFGNLDSNEPKEDRKPNFDGTINVEGKEFKISGWVRTGKLGGKMAGRKFLSIKVEPKQAKPASRSDYDWKSAEAKAPPALAAREAAIADFDDDIPF